MNFTCCIRAPINLYLCCTTHTHIYFPLKNRSPEKACNIKNQTKHILNIDHKIIKKKDEAF